MTSTFDDLDAVLSDAICGVFQEEAVLRPRTPSQYSEPQPDPDRDEVPIIGVFSAGPADGQLRGQSRGAEFSGSTRLASMSAEFWIPSAVAGHLAYRPQKGDLIVLTTRPAQPRYSVSQVEPSDMNDLNLILVREDP